MLTVKISFLVTWFIDSAKYAFAAAMLHAVNEYDWLSGYGIGDFDWITEVTLITVLIKIFYYITSYKVQYIAIEQCKTFVFCVMCTQYV